MSKFLKAFVILFAILVALVSFYVHDGIEQGEGKPVRRTVRIEPEDTPYEAWLLKAKAEIPIFAGSVIEDVRTIALKPWPQMGAGVNGLYLRFRLPDDGRAHSGNTRGRQDGAAASHVRDEHLFLWRPWTYNDSTRGEATAKNRLGPSQPFLDTAQCALPAFQR